MAIVTEISWDDMLDGKLLVIPGQQGAVFFPETPSRPLFTLKARRGSGLGQFTNSLGI